MKEGLDLLSRADVLEKILVLWAKTEYSRWYFVVISCHRCVLQYTTYLYLQHFSRTWTETTMWKSSKTRKISSSTAMRFPKLLTIFRVGAWSTGSCDLSHKTNGAYNQSYCRVTRGRSRLVGQNNTETTVLCFYRIRTSFLSAIMFRLSDHGPIESLFCQQMAQNQR